MGATLLCNYNKAIDPDKGDTSQYILILFRDLQFQALEEYRSIRFTTSKGSARVFQFIKDLKAAHAKQGAKTEQVWKRESYNISVSNSSDLLYLEDGKKGGYTGLSKKSVENLIEWLGKIGFKI